MRMRLHEGARAQLRTLADLGSNGMSIAARDLERIYGGLGDLVLHDDDGEEVREALILVGMMRRTMTLREIVNALHMMEAQRKRPPSMPPPGDDDEHPPDSRASGLLELARSLREGDEEP